MMRPLLGRSSVAIPVFGFFAHERVACVLLMLSGLAGFLLTITGQEGMLPTWAHCATWHPGHLWLTGQSLLVTAGGLAAFRARSFALAMTGIAASLVFRTPVGAVTVVPGVLLLAAIGLRWRGFPGFAPRWRGRGLPPPGYWR